MRQLSASSLFASCFFVITGNSCGIGELFVVVVDMLFHYGFSYSAVGNYDTKLSEWRHIEMEKSYSVFHYEDWKHAGNILYHSYQCCLVWDELIVAIVIEFRTCPHHANLAAASYNKPSEAGYYIVDTWCSFFIKMPNTSKILHTLFNSFLSLDIR